MINVTVSENGQTLDEIEFDDSNIVRREGGVAVVHRRIMEDCQHAGLWYRVAHAAAWIAEAGSLLDAMKAQAQEPMQRLLERLQSGWQPKTDEIDTRILQHRIFRWHFAPSFSRPEAVIVGLTENRDVIRSEPIVWIDRNLNWTLCDDGFWWLQ